MKYVRVLKVTMTMVMMMMEHKNLHYIDNTEICTISKSIIF